MPFRNLSNDDRNTLLFVAGLVLYLIGLTIFYPSAYSFMGDTTVGVIFEIGRILGVLADFLSGL